MVIALCNATKICREQANKPASNKERKKNKYTAANDQIRNKINMHVHRLKNRINTQQLVWRAGFRELDANSCRRFSMQQIYRIRSFLSVAFRMRTQPSFSLNSAKYEKEKKKKQRKRGSSSHSSWHLIENVYSS